MARQGNTKVIFVPVRVAPLSPPLRAAQNEQELTLSLLSPRPQMNLFGAGGNGSSDSGLINNAAMQQALTTTVQ